MILTTLDLAVILLYLVIALVVGLALTRRAGRSPEQFFLSDRRLPWWLAGTSMVATTFAADTPLAVTGLTAKHGIAGNWLWWSFVMSGMLTVFFYARLWRRAAVMTDAEFAEIRYAGRPAAFLRAFRACYLAIPINCIIMGWVTHAMATIAGLTLGVEKWTATVALFLLTALYSTLSGLWGVVLTDLFQFGLAMAGSIALAVFALRAVGGLDGLLSGLHARFPGGEPLALLPDLHSAWMPALTFFVYVSVNWWASWYPGAEPGGGGYVAQRILATKNERHAFLAALWFNLAHYVLRPWPWIIVALCSLLLHPGLANPEEGYVRVMIDHLPPVWRGLLLASFFAAYMSTISTHLNWGASYLVNDLYRRHVRRVAPDEHYAMIGRCATVGLMVLSGVITYHLQSVEGAWKFLLAIGAGTGLVYLLRWYWWRVNAWSEVSAMAAAFVLSTVLQFGVGLDAGDPRHFGWLMLLTVTGTTAVWLAVTLLTPAEPMEHLRTFYARVRPGGAGWVKVAGQAAKDGPGWTGLLRWVIGCCIVYLALFGTGDLFLGRPLRGSLLIATALGLTLWILARDEGRAAEP